VVGAAAWHQAGGPALASSRWIATVTVKEARIEQALYFHAIPDSTSCTRRDRTALYSASMSIVYVDALVRRSRIEELARMLEHGA
jgi:hypothetical protein